MVDRFKTFRKHISTWLNKLSAFVYPNGHSPSRNKFCAPNDNSASLKNCGGMILDAGWRQGSFISTDKVTLPSKLQSSSDIPYIIICSQSCTTVSPCLERDPYVEFIVARPISQYNPRVDAATGKTPRKLHLQVLDGVGFPALELSINDRFEADRSCLLQSAPLTSIALQKGESTKLTNWLAKNYSRVAMPNRLVERLAEHFYKEFEKFLKTIMHGYDHRLHCYVDNIFISWDPDDESDNYLVKLLLITENEDVVEQFETHYAPKIEHLRINNTFGFKFIVLDCQLKNEIFLSDLDGYTRLSSYDYFTSLEEWHNLSIASQ